MRTREETGTVRTREEADTVRTGGDRHSEDGRTVRKGKRLRYKHVGECYCAGLTLTGGDESDRAGSVPLPSENQFS